MPLILWGHWLVSKFPFRTMTSSNVHFAVEYKWTALVNKCSLGVNIFQTTNFFFTRFSGSLPSEQESVSFARCISFKGFEKFLRKIQRTDVLTGRWTPFLSAKKLLFFNMLEKFLETTACICPKFIFWNKIINDIIYYNLLFRAKKMIRDLPESVNDFIIVPKFPNFIISLQEVFCRWEMRYEVQKLAEDWSAPYCKISWQGVIPGIW